MKTPKDPRHQRRIRIVKQLFSYSFVPQKNLLPKTRQIIKNLKLIDPQISQAAPEWPIEKLNKIDLAILRLAVFELLVEKKEPPKVIIDEAVELAKEFGSEKSPKFINGALGNIVKRQKLITN